MKPVAANIAHEFASLPQRQETFRERTGVRFLFNCHNRIPCHNRTYLYLVPAQWVGTKSLPQKQKTLEAAFELTHNGRFGDAGCPPLRSPGT